MWRLGWIGGSLAFLGLSPELSELVFPVLGEGSAFLSGVAGEKLGFESLFLFVLFLLLDGSLAMAVGLAVELVDSKF